MVKQPAQSYTSSEVSGPRLNLLMDLRVTRSQSRACGTKAVGLGLSLQENELAAGGPREPLDVLSSHIWKSSGLTQNQELQMKTFKLYTSFFFEIGFFFLIFLLELIYNVLSISAVQQSDPIIPRNTFFFSYYLLSCSVTSDWL